MGGRFGTDGSNSDTNIKDDGKGGGDCGHYISLSFVGDWLGFVSKKKKKKNLGVFFSLTFYEL